MSEKNNRPDLQKILKEAKTLAILGCSPERSRTSYGIALQLKRKGFRIVPVNPHHDRILGETCYDIITDIPEDTGIDIAVIFRRPEFTEAMVQTIVDRSGQTNKKTVVWTQIGVSTPEAEQLAAGNGLIYVRNRCIGVELARS